LHQHLAGARRGQQKLHGVEQLLFAMALHAAGQIETQRGERRPTQRLLIERQRLLNDGRLRRPDHRQGAAGVHIGLRVGVDRRGAPKLDPPSGRRDARLRLALEQEGLKVCEKALDFPCRDPDRQSRAANRRSIRHLQGRSRKAAPFRRRSACRWSP
jgi:hypothetical protein